MTRQEVEQTAVSVMSTGYNCAETILRLATDHLGIPGDGASTRIATCFGGGVGRSHAEICGALSGAVMALGLAYGRDASDISCTQAHALASAFRQRFIEQFGSSCCATLRESLGRHEADPDCKRLVADTAGLLHEFLMEQRQSH
ncbi:C_GCAxxG_C_C family protein [Solidesulfovibrio fructosivorans JJ]]|uniref:C_GCAxxG_C_C family protein n=1 Tax=Solidesulfovibrio fructosivorans JJ] TaxID=596151 RepID=E1JTU8_SOLFR|nr:C-GCAxxG-C-C family protein [Solidesulfovibrio fructosivorans]EFL52227.1 C_GCAxxG_C_C family protein [Solidesulfovibrio fructosivorans JJ]]